MDKLTEVASTSFEDIIPATPVDKDRKPKKLHKLSKRCDVKTIPPAEPEILLKLKHTPGPLRSKVYIFHSFKEVLNYNPKRKPVNDYVKIIGQYKTSRCHIPYILSYEKNERNLPLFINLKIVDDIPKIDESIEIYGQLDFQDVMHNSLPIVVVHFWVRIDGNIPKYIECLKTLTTFLPKAAFEIQSKPEEEEDDTLMVLIQDLSLGIISME